LDCDLSTAPSLLAEITGVCHQEPTIFCILIMVVECEIYTGVYRFVHPKFNFTPCYFIIQKMQLKRKYKIMFKNMKEPPTR
jgi:hypothetical protein